MEDEFEHAVMEAGEPADAGLIGSLTDTLRLVRARHPHTARAVESCLKGLQGTPTMMHVLVAAYVLNGGIPIKYDFGPAADEDDVELDRFLHEISLAEAPPDKPD
jgi:hypothetical protein